MYDEAMSGVKNKLVQRTRASGMVYTAELAFQRSGDKQYVQQRVSLAAKPSRLRTAPFRFPTLPGAGI
jgi:hypothetical protein